MLMKTGQLTNALVQACPPAHWIGPALDNSIFFTKIKNVTGCSGAARHFASSLAAARLSYL